MLFRKFARLNKLKIISIVFLLIFFIKVVINLSSINNRTFSKNSKNSKVFKTNLNFSFNQDYLLLKEKFKYILNEYCNAKENENSLTCIEKLKEFDLLFGTFKENNSKNYCTIFNYALNNNASKFYYHTFWQITNRKTSNNEYFKKVMKLNIMSYLYSQNLCCSKMIVWLAFNFGEEFEKELKKTFEYFIKNDNLEFKKLDLEEICSYNDYSFYSSFREHALCSKESFDKIKKLNANSVQLSDLLRFVVLDLYGGIYSGNYQIINIKF